MDVDWFFPLGDLTARLPQRGEAFVSDLDSLSPRNEAKKEKRKKSTQRRQFKTIPLIIFPGLLFAEQIFFSNFFFSSANMKRADRGVE